jgi:undecaprenyl phosphate N,N'-diacetylbacillosamine 1-phosphate transferase
MRKERTRWFFLVKRGIDIIASVIGGLLASPILLAAAIAVWVEDRSARPFFSQQRIGRCEKPFKLLKLRTMRTERFDGDRKLTDSERLLRTGRWLRKLSIDELPQLWNVLCGEMSFIGPRPMPIAYLPYFRPEERVRHRVRPGLSGLAQVNGRNFLSWDDKFALDVRYVENLSFTLDIEIFFKTVAKLFLPAGVGVRGEDLSSASLHEERQPWKTD